MRLAKTTAPVLALLFFGLLLFTYANHFENDFHFDDFHTIVDNVHIRNIKNIPHFFSDPKMFSALPDHWSLRPLVTTTIAIDYWLGGGLNPFYFHLSNFSWFVLICVLLFFLYRHVLSAALGYPQAMLLSLIAAAWYALHPANAETVNYIISRSDILSTLGIVASFLLFVRYPSRRKWSLYLLPALLGALAKETTAMLVPILFCYVWLFEKQLSASQLFQRVYFKTALQVAKLLLPLVVMMVLVQYYTVVRTPLASSNFSNPFLPYVATQPYIWLHYCTQLILPLRLSADTDMGVFTSLSDGRMLLGFLFLGLLVWGIFRCSAHAALKPAAFGLLWFVFALLPTSIAPLSEVANDHRMFFPFIGLVLTVVTLVAYLWNRYAAAAAAMRLPVLRAAWVAVFLVLGAYAYGTRQRNKVWRSEESLWYDVVVKSPRNGRGLMNYGLTQMAKGDYQSALSYFDRAVPFTPRYALLYVNMGIAKGGLNQLAAADSAFLTAIQLDSTNYSPYYYYAQFLKQHNDTGKARELVEKSIQFNPYFIDSRYLHFELLAAAGEWDSLAIRTAEVLQFAPADAQVLAFKEQSKKREHSTDAAIKIAANNPTPESYLNLSLQLYQSGQYRQCIEACKKALKLNPDYADAYSNMCAAYNNLKEYKNAEEACSKALAIAPNHKLANGNLRWARSELNKK